VVEGESRKVHKVKKKKRNSRTEESLNSDAQDDPPRGKGWGEAVVQVRRVRNKSGNEKGERNGQTRGGGTPESCWITTKKGVIKVWRGGGEGGRRIALRRGKKRRGAYSLGEGGGTKDSSQRGKKG